MLIISIILLLHIAGSIVYGSKIVFSIDLFILCKIGMFLCEILIAILKLIGWVQQGCEFILRKLHLHK